VKGWVKIHSYTDPRENIIAFSDWILRRDAREQRFEVEEARCQGKRIVAKLRGMADRDGAAPWVGADIAVRREELPACAPGEFYWADLEGLRVETTDGRPLGEVRYMIATGAHDVMVVDGDRQRLIPFVLGGTVREVSLERGLIVVDWKPDY
jgi:16S rRNA processing protein RimM